MLLLLFGTSALHLRAQSVTVDYIHSVPTCVGQEIQFWPLPTPPDGPYRKLWDYGDGSILTLSDEHTYTSPGTYTVRLDLMDTLTWTLAASVSYDLDVGASCDSAYFIKGRVYYDENDDWVLSPGEIGYPGVILRADPGPYYAISGSDGTYTLGLPEGTYTVSADVSGLSGLHPNQPAAWSYSASFSGPYSSSTGNDFGVAPDSLFTDLQVELTGWLSVLIPGAATPQFFSVCNQGTTVNSGRAGLVLPEDSDPGAALPSYYTTMGDTVEWSFAPVPPGHCQDFSIKVKGDTTLTLGETFQLFAYVRTPGDSRLANNRDSINGTVMTSYDPNDKSVMPAGEGPEHQVDTTDEWFHYMIRFQNLGTGPAIDIRIKDSLDASVFEVGSFQALGGTHPHNVDIRGNAVVTWSFDDIYLPHADANEAESMGAVTFRIKRKSGLPIGTQLNNTAAIYFDYNEAVVTNTAFVTLWADTSGTSGVLTPEAARIPVRLFPNPGGEQVYMAFELKETQRVRLKAYDQSGRLVYNRDLGVLPQGPHQTAFVSSTWASGTYHLVLEMPSASFSGTWVKP